MNRAAGRLVAVAVALVLVAGCGSKADERNEEFYKPGGSSSSISDSPGGSGGAQGKLEGGAAAAANSKQEVADATVNGAPLPDLPESKTVLVPAGDDPAVGKTPPALRGESFDGSEVSIDPADGRAKLVVFLAHWCPHCQAELPRIQEWMNAGEVPDDVDVYAVSTATASDRSNYPPSKWILREKFTGPVLLDNADSEAALAYGLTGFPYFVAINADGTVAQRGSGEVPLGDFQALMKKLTP